MAGESYEGTNRETWVVKIWLASDEPLSMYMQDVDLSTGEKFEIFFKYGLNAAMKRSILNDIGPNGSIDNVDWDKLAEIWAEE